MTFINENTNGESAILSSAVERILIDMGNAYVFEDEREVQVKDLPVTRQAWHLCDMIDEMADSERGLTRQEKYFLSVAERSGLYEWLFKAIHLRKG